MHIMIDLETLGKKPGCAVIQIAAATFDPYAGVLPSVPNGPGSTFARNIDLLSCVMAGLIIDPETVEWWRGREFEARNALIANKGELPTVVDAFYAWCKAVAGDSPVIMWAKSPDFDCAIWEAAANAVGNTVPWDFRGKRDVRTAEEMGHVSDKDFAPDPGRHIGARDVTRQIDIVQAAYKSLKPAPIPAILGGIPPQAPGQ